MNRLLISGIGVLLVLAVVTNLPAQTVARAVPTASAATGDGAGSIALKHKAVRKWKVKLPAEKFSPVGTRFSFSDTLGNDFVARIEGTALLVDTDGDGKTDVKVEGQNGFLTLQGKDTRYAVRLVNQQGWRFAAGGVMTGTINGTKIRLIDQNNNGHYDDIGADAMIVGRGKVACFLSETVNVDGKLYSVSVSRNGTTLEYAPYAGKTGTLHLGDCKTNAKVLGAVVMSADDRFSFELARAANGLLVPVGDYVLHSGEMGLGSTRVKMRTGRSHKIAVAAGNTTKVAWGGPVAAEFAYRRKGDKVHLNPDEIWYYGAAGEEYHSFFPNGKSPAILIANRKTGREIAQAYFPGSC